MSITPTMTVNQRTSVAVFEGFAILRSNNDEMDPHKMQIFEFLSI